MSEFVVSESNEFGIIRELFLEYSKIGKRCPFAKANHPTAKQRYGRYEARKKYNIRKLYFIGWVIIDGDAQQLESLAWL